MLHSVSILYSDGPYRGVMSYNGATCYNEARAWLHSQFTEMRAKGYRIRAFNLSSIRAA